MSPVFIIRTLFILALLSYHWQFTNNASSQLGFLVRTIVQAPHSLVCIIAEPCQNPCLHFERVSGRGGCKGNLLGLVEGLVKHGSPILDTVQIFTLWPGSPAYYLTFHPFATLSFETEHGSSPTDFCIRPTEIQSLTTLVNNLKSSRFPHCKTFLSLLSSAVDFCDWERNLDDAKRKSQGRKSHSKSQNGQAKRLHKKDQHV